MIIGRVPGGHIAGLPIEETLGTLGPALLVIVGAVLVSVRARLHRVRPGGRRDLGDSSD